MSKSERVREPSESGWLSPAEVGALLGETFGRPVPARTVQLWCHRSRDPLPHARLGARLLIHRAELTAWIGKGGTTMAGPPAAA